MDLIILFNFFYIIYALILLYEFSLKTGRKWYELYIPLYSYYVLFKIAGMDIYWFMLWVIPGIFIYILSEYMIVIVLSYIFSIIIYLLFCYFMARKFDKGIWFTLGLFFLNPIFMGILAFSKNCVYNI